MVEQPVPVGSRPRACARSRRGRSDRAARRRSCADEEVLAAVHRRRPGSRAPPARRTTATSSAATRRSRRCRACTPPRGTPRRGSAAPSPSSASAARDRAGTPPPRRATASARSGVSRHSYARRRAAPSSDSTLQYSPAMPTAAILTIGNELTSATSRTRTASWLAQAARAARRERDDPRRGPRRDRRVARFIRREAAEVDFVLVTGGLGGTPDDLTREAIAAAFGVGQEMVPELAAALRARFTRDPEYAARWAALPVGSRAARESARRRAGLRDRERVRLARAAGGDEGDVRDDRAASSRGAPPIDVVAAHVRDARERDRRRPRRGAASASRACSSARTRSSARADRRSRSSSSRATREQLAAAAEYVARRLTPSER